MTTLNTRTHTHADKSIRTSQYRDESTVPESRQLLRQLRRHKHEISRWINILELLPHLNRSRLITSEKARRRLLSLHDRRKQSRLCTYLFKVLARCRGADPYGNFIVCLRNEREHLGHHYIADLLESRVAVAADDDDIRRASRLVYRAMLVAEPRIKDCLSIKDLLPYLRQSKLLTLSEYELLREDFVHENSWKVQQLLTILSTKGPTAYYLFFLCLEKEQHHRGHRDIYKELCLTIDNLLRDTSTYEINEEGLPLVKYEPYAKTPCRLGLEGSLAGEEHVREMRALQQHRYHGRWDCFMQGINGLTLSDDIDVAAVGKLHNAVASIMFGNTKLSLQLVDEVERMCSMLYGNNHPIMIGRCLYIRSAVYRHCQDYDNARHFLDLSKQKLVNSEPGADTASLYYHEGTLQLDLLQQSGSRNESQREAAERSFRMAVEHAEHDNSGLPLIAWHSKVFLALLYLGSSHDSVSSEVPSKNDLNLAKSILDSLDCEQLPPRTLALYHLAYSDIHRWNRDLVSARHHAGLGLTKAEQGNFAFEKRFAMHRLECL